MLVITNNQNCFAITISNNCKLFFKKLRLKHLLPVKIIFVFLQNSQHSNKPLPKRPYKLINAIEEHWKLNNSKKVEIRIFLFLIVCELLNFDFTIFLFCLLMLN